MRRLILFFGIIGFSFSAKGQDYSYSASYGQDTWQELNTQTILNTNNSAWNFFYKIPIGFTFNYCGRNFDSIRIETNGFFVFDEDHYYSFTAFSQLTDHIDGSGNHAVIGYQLSGSSGNHILKIQFKNAAVWEHPETCTYQVWFRENGNLVELHTGPTLYVRHIIEIDTTRDQNNSITSIDTVFSEVDSTISWGVGVINQNMDLDINCYCLGGDPDSPYGQSCNENHPDEIMLIAPPKPNMRYTFTPAY